MNIIVVLLTLWLTGEEAPRVYTYTAESMNECFAKISALRDAITPPGVIGYSLDCVDVTGERIHAS